MAELSLEIVEGKERGRHVTLDRTLDLGREPGLPLTLDDEQVSRRHARLEPGGRGATVEDLGSTNGTYVNDQPITGALELEPGDRVRVGLTVLELRSNEQVATQPSAARPVPEITQLAQDVLRPVPEAELEPPLRTQGPPGVTVDETEPAFVPKQVLDDEQARQDFGAVARLVDVRVKQQTNIAVFALLSLAGLAVGLFFGLR